MKYLFSIILVSILLTTSACNTNTTSTTIQSESESVASETSTEAPTETSTGTSTETSAEANQTPQNETNPTPMVKDEINIPPNTVEYDIVVIGGEPEGVAAALSAARNGKKTLLVEERDGLGGLFTFGEMNFIDFPLGIEDRWTSRGIFKEWHQQLGLYNSFGIEKAKQIFLDMVTAEENIVLELNTSIQHIMKNNEQHSIDAIIVKNPQEEYLVKAAKWIDATQDAGFAVEAGVPYYVGGEDIGIPDKQMAVTLVLHFKDVDWNGVKQAVETRKFGYANMNDHVAWGFNDLHYDYKPVEDDIRLRGLNMAKISNDVYINALQIFNVDGLNEESKLAAIEKGKRETEHILQFLQKEFPGFENAQIADFPPELYVRETRHIHSEYQLPMSDLWKNVDHWDSIAIGGYPVDVQAQSTKDYGYVIAHPTQYAIPFRSLVPLEVEDLLVVGRSSGYSSLAAGSTRIVATGMATGEAAGVAAALAIDENTSFRELAKNEAQIEQVRTKLKEQGAYLDHFSLSYPYQNEWYSEAISTLMDYGLLVAGYNNELQVNQQKKTHSFVYLLRNTIKRANSNFYDEKIQEMTDLDYYLYLEDNVPLTRDKMAEMLASIWMKGRTSSDVPIWDQLYNEGLIDEKIYTQLPNDKVLQNKEIYYILAGIIEAIKN